MNDSNLKPFQPGESGNPNGRPKKLPGLDKLLEQVLGEDLAEAKAILQALILKAKKGNVRAASLILNRAFGKETIPISVEIPQNATIDYTRLSENALKEILAATTTIDI